MDSTPIDEKNKELPTKDRILLSIMRDAKSPSKIAKELNMTDRAVLFNLKNLRDKVERNDDPNDGRRSLYRLKPKLKDSFSLSFLKQGNSGLIDVVKDGQHFSGSIPDPPLDEALKWETVHPTKNTNSEADIERTSESISQFSTDEGQSRRSSSAFEQNINYGPQSLPLVYFSIIQMMEDLEILLFTLKYIRSSLRDFDCLVEIYNEVARNQNRQSLYHPLNKDTARMTDLILDLLNFMEEVIRISPEGKKLLEKLNESRETRLSIQPFVQVWKDTFGGWSKKDRIKLRSMDPTLAKEKIDIFWIQRIRDNTNWQIELFLDRLNIFSTKVGDLANLTAGIKTKQIVADSIATKASRLAGETDLFVGSLKQASFFEESPGVPSEN